MQDVVHFKRVKLFKQEVQHTKNGKKFKWMIKKDDVDAWSNVAAMNCWMADALVHQFLFLIFSWFFCSWNQSCNIDE